jgi:undecaprenyl phosphate-alpha-L-ara4FN deformylase
LARHRLVIGRPRKTRLTVRLKTLEIPTTLPTWDEMLGDPQFGGDQTKFLAFYKKQIRGTEVHSIHTEVEGTALLELFRRQLEGWYEDGVKFVTLEDIAQETLKTPEKIPVRRLLRAVIPGRGGEITSSV